LIDWMSKIYQKFAGVIRVESTDEIRNGIDQYIDLPNEDPVAFSWKCGLEEKEKILGGIMV